jgi:hypothetical protein
MQRLHDHDADDAADHLDAGVPTFLVRGDVYCWGSLIVACPSAR